MLVNFGNPTVSASYSYDNAFCRMWDVNFATSTEIAKCLILYIKYLQEIPVKNTRKKLQVLFPLLFNFRIVQCFEIIFSGDYK